MTPEEVAERFGARRSGDGWSARCPVPAHGSGSGDRSPSLSISPGRDGGVVVCCHADCPTSVVLDAVGLTWADLAPPDSNGERRRIVATYGYHDELGTLLYETVRYHPKDFRQRRPDGGGGWVWNLHDTRRVLFRLPEVLDAIRNGERIWIVEGEKDVLVLTVAGVVATCNVLGASKGKSKWLPEYTAALAGANDIVIVADKDKAGRAHARQVATALAAPGRAIAVVEAAAGHNDVSDHLGAGIELDEMDVVASTDPAHIVGTTVLLDVWLAEPAEEEPEPEPAEGEPKQDDRPRLVLTDWSKWRAVDDEHVADGLLVAGRWTQLVAKKKEGKSTVALWIAVELSEGRDPWTAAARAPITVLYVDSEMGEGDIEEKLGDFGHDPIDLKRFRLCTVPVPLDATTGAGALLGTVDDLSPAVVVLDGLSGHVRGDENDTATWAALYMLVVAELKRRRIAVLSGDNFGKDVARGARGASAKEDKADASFQVVRGQGGAVLTRKFTRSKVFAETITLAMTMTVDGGVESMRRTDGPPPVPIGTAEAIKLLDELDVPAALSREAVRRRYLKPLADAGDDRCRVSNGPLNAAIRVRRERLNRL